MNINLATAAPAALADWALNRLVIIAGQDEYIPTEVEVYRDLFTHGHPLQETAGHWYFHRSSKSPDAKYKGGTYKGLDITCGAPGRPGGILIRAIQQLSRGGVRVTQAAVYDKGPVYEGPCNTVQRLLAACGQTEIEELVATLGTTELQVVAADSDLSPAVLTVCEVESRGMPVYSAPRVGLTLKVEQYERVAAIMKELRFFTVTPTKDRYLIALAQERQGKKEAEILQISRVTAVAWHQYKAWADAARDWPAPYWLGRAFTSVSDVCGFYGAWCTYMAIE